MPSAILIWEWEGRLKKHELSPGSQYLGRPTIEYLKVHQSLDPFSVYILPPNPGSGEPVLTSNNGYTVSRLHVLLRITGDHLEVKDHGPTGQGAKNTTLVNGVALARGGSKTFPLNKCWTATLRLSSIGPLYTLVPGQCSRPEGPIRLSLPADSVHLLPRSLAEELRGRGLVEEEALLGDAVVVVVRSPDPGKSGLDIVILGEDPHNIRIAPSSGKPAGGKWHISDLQVLATHLRDLRVHIYREDWERVEELAHVVSLEHFTKIMRGLGDQVFREYEQLLYHLIDRRSYSVNDLDRRLEKLIAVLDEEIRRIAAGAP